MSVVLVKVIHCFGTHFQRFSFFFFFAQVSVKKKWYQTNKDRMIDHFDGICVKELFFKCAFVCFCFFGFFFHLS